jgi:hypothetical protein
MHSTLYSQLFVFLHITIETWGAGSWNLFERVIIFNPFLVIQGPYGCITTHKTLYDHLIPLSIYLSSWSSITFLKSLLPKTYLLTCSPIKVNSFCFSITYYKTSVSVHGSEDSILLKFQLSSRWPSPGLYIFFL